MSEPTFNLEHLSKLARIRLSEEEKSALTPQMEAIIGYCSKLVAADVDGLEPMVRPFEQETNVWFEEDVPETASQVDFLSANAPEMKENQIVIPKVL